jgi:hypothetical protein
VSGTLWNVRIGDNGTVRFSIVGADWEIVWSAKQADALAEALMAAARIARDMQTADDLTALLHEKEPG